MSQENHICDDQDERRFKRARKGTFEGFEKDGNLAWNGSFRFIQAADPQFGLIDEFKNVDWDGPVEIAVAESAKYKARGVCVWDEEIRLCNRAVDQWNHMTPRPKFVVICGDLVNDFPGDRQRRTQIQDFRSTFRRLRLDIPLVLLPGNHDLLNRPSTEAVLDYRRDFGDDYFSFWVGGVMFIVLNVQYYKDRSNVQQLAVEHDRWIEERLDEIKSERHRYKHVIVFQHIPWFLRSIDEPDDDMFNIAMSDRKRMIQKFSDAGIRAIFAGHYHRNAGGKYQDLELVVTSAMGAQNTGGGLPPDRSGYRVVQVDEESISHQYVEIERPSSEDHQII